jgi:hypothetical protein
MTRILWKVVYPEHMKIRIKNKESSHWEIITTVWEERKRVREKVKWTIWIHHLVCQRKDIRIKPYEIVRLKNYIWTVSWAFWNSDFIIWNISGWWIQIISEKQLCIWDLIEISFTLDVNYRLEWKIIWRKWKIYWVQFLIWHDSLSSIQKNYMNLIKLLISVDLK